MAKLTLLIGNKNYSSWSLRPWLVLHAFGVDFEEIQIKLMTEEAKPTLKKYSPTGKVPVLIDETQNDRQHIWDSLSIAEYANEHFIEAEAWGVNPAMARSIVCEMHAGFFGLRNDMPMNIRATRKITPSQKCLADILRVDTLFIQLREKYASHGDYLFGDFSIADAFYAPVVYRFRTYAEHSGIELSDTTHAYCQTMLAHPSMQAWEKEALKEKGIIVMVDEAGVDV